MDKVEHYTSADGTYTWKLNGNFHRDDGPAVTWADGSQFWYTHGHLHREDGPAIDRTDRYRAWYRHNRRHRIDGPAIIHSDGTAKWFIDGTMMPFDQFCTKLKLTPGQILELKLKYG